MAVAIPTLTPNKFIYDPNVILEKIYLYYITTEVNQTLSFYGSVKSIRDAFNRGNHEAEKVQECIEEDLYHIVSNYFPEAEINVDVNKKAELVGKNKILYEIGIDITVKDSYGKIYSLSKTLESVNFNSLMFNNQLDFIFREMYDNN